MAKQSVITLLFIVITGVVQSIVNDENFLNHSGNDAPISIVNSDLMSLSELPLEQLLKIRKSMRELRQATFQYEPKDAYEEEEDTMESRMIESAPNTVMKKTALALTEEQRINRKTGYEMENPWDSKPSKVQTFFQISITALAFLAFAGYLLCMIVQAIKAKQTMYMYNNNAMALTSGGLNTMNSVTGAGSVPLLRKRRPVGRRRRDVFLSSDNMNATSLLASPDPAEMYHVMIQCAEDYTKLYFIQ